MEVVLQVGLGRGATVHAGKAARKVRPEKSRFLGLMALHAFRTSFRKTTGYTGSRSHLPRFLAPWPKAIPTITMIRAVAGEWARTAQRKKGQRKLQP